MQLGQLTQKQQHAARLLAERKLTGEQIAEQVGISPRTLDYWKTDPTFQAEVLTIRNLWRETVKVRGVADPEFRMRVLNTLYMRGLAIIQERGKAMKHVPGGGKTGLLVRSVKMRGIGGGEQLAEDEYEVDTGLMAEIRAIGRQAAHELGQDRPEVSDEDAQALIQRLEEGRRRAAEAARKLSEVSGSR